jgi:hypothetical protein
LGIGTSSPLSVGGYTFTDMVGSTGAQYRVRTSTSDLRVGADASATFVSSTNTSLWFGANNAEGMRLTSTGLGIGTSSPGAKLDVNGNVTFNGKLFSNPAASISGDVAANLVNTSATGYGLRVAGGASGAGYALSVNNYLGTELMQVNGAGNLGLGVTPANWYVSRKALSIYNGASFTGVSDGGAEIWANAYLNAAGNSIYVSTNAAALYQVNRGGAGVHAWFNAPSGTAGSTISFTQSMTLNSSGQLGVGVTNPVERLDVQGNIQIRASGSINLSNNDNTNQFYFQNTGTTGANNANLLFQKTNYGEVARIDSSGNFGIATSSPKGPLDVASGASILIAKPIATVGSPNLGTYKGYLLLAKAYTSGTVNPSWVNGTFCLKRGSTGSGNRTDVYTVSSNTAYTSDDLLVQVVCNASPFFTQTCKVTYGGVVYHAIETSVSGGNPDDGVWFTGSYENCSPIYVDASYVSSITAFGMSTYIQSAVSPGTVTVIDSAGNLGLGVTPSGWGSGQKAFQIGNSGGLSDNGGTYFNFNNNCYFNGSNWIYKNTATASQFQSNGNNFYWQQAASGTAGNPITFTQAMTLTASGNLLVGTTTESGAKIVVGGTTSGALAGNRNALQLRNSNSSGNQSNFLVFGSAGTESSCFIGNDLAANGTEVNVLSFGTAATEAMRLDSSGNLLVGTTSRGHNGGATSFDLDKTDGALYVTHATGTPTGYYFASFGYNTTSIGSITQSGTTAVLYNVTSDQRLKENIQDAADAASLIDSLQVRQFDWKADNSHQRYGFIAQELVTVAPEAVHQPADPEEMMAVDYSKLVPMLVKEIQSLRKRLAAAGIA